MYIVPIAWLYVAVMMSAAEATNSNGTVLGAVVTFVFYGLLPVGLVLYIMGTPGRKRALRARAEQEQAEYLARTSAQDSSSGAAPDASSHAAADAITPVGKEP
jgi:hypothetical protein